MERTELQKLRKKLISKAKKQVQEKYSGRDVHIIRAVNALEDLDSIFNLLAEHCREWYSVHFPELNLLVSDNENYLKLVSELRERKNFTFAKLEKYFKEGNAARKISEKAESGMGSEIQENDFGEITELAKNALSIKRKRNALAAFIETEMNSLMPNFSALAGPVLGAKMLSEAGSIRKIALMPSSTMQLLGAEEALFRHIKTGAKPPKYGLLFQHPIVKQMKPWQRGAAARTIAGKLSIAAKEDFFSKKKINDSLKKELDARIEEIKSSHKEPKKKKQRR